MRLKNLYFVLFFIIKSGITLAQTGSWQPSGANSAYPRTLLQAQEVPAVQLALATGASYGLYEGLYNGLATQPTDNSSSSGRRARATLAKNLAFVALLERRPGPGGLVPLGAGEKDMLVARTKELLESCNPAVETFISGYSEWQWRSKELIDYLIAYDLLRGAGETEASMQMAQNRLQEFAGNLYAQSTTTFFGVGFYNTVKNNHALMTAAALGMAAVVLNHVGGSTARQQPQAWINAGMYNLDNVLWRDARRQSDPTAVAGYAEGPYYFKYAFLNCLPFFRAMGHFLPDNVQAYTYGGSTRSIANPYHDPQYARLYDWITAILMPDGRLPALEDSFVDMGMPELALTGQSRYVKPLHLSRVTGTSLASLTAQLRDQTVDMRAAYLAANLAPTTPTAAPLTVLPKSGNLVFRSGNDSLSCYLHVYGKHGPALLNSGGHNQGDASSFILHAYGQLLALDPGYLSSARRLDLGNATNHNLILVDDKGPVIGSAGAANDAEAFIQNALQTPKLTYGEVQTTYQGAAITRKTLFVRNTYFILADAVRASALHTYTWQLHGYGLEGGTASTGSFTDNLQAGEGTWQKNGVHLLAHVSAAGGASSYTKTTAQHELTYNTAENHTTLLVRKSGRSQTQFLAVLYPYTTQQQLATTTTSIDSTAGLSSTGKGFRDVVFAKSDTLPTSHTSPLLPQPILADGLLNFYSADSTTAFAQAFLQQGTLLRYGTTVVMQSLARATTSWQQNGPFRYEGSTSRPTTLILTLPGAPTQVQGPGVAAYSYSLATRQLHITLAEASAFTVFTSAATTGQTIGPLPVTLVQFAGKRQGAQGQVALSWQTASEQQNAGFAVQRSLTATAAFTTIGFVPGKGTTSQATTYQFLDPQAPTAPAYYRLQQTDLNGKVTYSPLVAVAGAATTNISLSVFPVPARQELTVVVSGSENEILVTLRNSQGELVQEQRLSQTARFDVSRLPAGLYYLQAQTSAGQRLAKAHKVLITR